MFIWRTTLSIRCDAKCWSILSNKETNPVHTVLMKPYFIRTRKLKWKTDTTRRFIKSENAFSPRYTEISFHMLCIAKNVNEEVWFLQCLPRSLISNPSDLTHFHLSGINLYNDLVQFSKSAYGDKQIIRCIDYMTRYAVKNVFIVEAE